MNTITAFNTFVTKTTIESAKVNQNFTAVIGDVIPIDPSLAVGDAGLNYGLGTTEYKWGSSYIEKINFGRTTTSWIIQDATTTGGGNLQFLLNGLSVAEINSSGFVIPSNANPNVVTKSAAYTATASDGIILADASNGAFALELFPGTDTGASLYLKKIDTSGNKVTVTVTGGGTIDDTTTIKLCTYNENFQLVADGTNWMILNHICNTPWVNTGALSVTATTSAPTKANTISSDVVWARRNGSDMEVRVEYFQATTGGGAAGSGDYQFIIPTSGIFSGSTIDTDKTSLTVGIGDVGGGHVSNNVNGYGNNGRSLRVKIDTSTTVKAFQVNEIDSIDALQILGSGNFPFSGRVAYSFNYKVPITDWEE